jgi:hypothetical protein
VAVIQDDVWSSGAVADGGDAFSTILNEKVQLVGAAGQRLLDFLEAYLVHLTPVDWTLPIAMPQHSDFDEWQSDPFAEEDFTNRSRNVAEGISNASYDEVLKEGGPLCERRLVLLRGEVPLFNEAMRESEYYL